MRIATDCPYNFCGDNWPLTERQLRRIDMNQRSLIKLIRLQDNVISGLFQRHILNERQQSDLNKQFDSVKKVDMLLDILRRKSVAQIKNCVEMLNQPDLTDIFLRDIGKFLFLMSNSLI